MKIPKLLLIGGGLLFLGSLMARKQSLPSTPPIIAQMELPPDVQPQPGVFNIVGDYRATDVSGYTFHSGTQSADLVDFAITTQSGQQLFKYFRTAPRWDDPTNTWGNNYATNFEGKSYDEWRKYFGI